MNKSRAYYKLSAIADKDAGLFLLKPGITSIYQDFFPIIKVSLAFSPVVWYSFMEEYAGMRVGKPALSFCMC